MIYINCVKKAIKGDEDAFEKLIKSQYDKLYKTAFLYVQNKEDALDVIQDTVYKAFISIRQLKQPKFFNTWLTKILIRSAYRLLERKKKIVLTDNLSLFNISENFDQSVEHHLDLAYAIATLNQNYQTVIILFYFHDLPLRLIAEMMEKPEGTIKTYLHRGKIELKRILEGGDQYGQKMV